MKEYFYRYTNHMDVALLDKYEVIKTTPCGVWIKDWTNYPKEKRFVLNGTGKRFAYRTEAEARVSFFKRKAREQSILETRLECVKGAVEAIKQNRIADYSSSGFNFDI